MIVIKKEAIARSETQLCRSISANKVQKAHAFLPIDIIIRKTKHKKQSTCS